MLDVSMISAVAELKVLVLINEGSITDPGIKMLKSSAVHVGIPVTKQTELNQQITKSVDLMTIIHTIKFVYWVNFLLDLFN
jgi:hypothetical protein